MAPAMILGPCQGIWFFFFLDILSFQLWIFNRMFLTKMMLLAFSIAQSTKRTRLMSYFYWLTPFFVWLLTFSVFQSYGDFPSCIPGLRLSPCRYGHLSQVRYPWGKPCYVFRGTLAVLCTNSPKEWREAENYRTLSKVATDLQFPLHEFYFKKNILQKQFSMRQS